MTPNHHHSRDARPEHVMLDLGPGVGALVLRTGADLHGVEVEIRPDTYLIIEMNLAREQ